MPRKTLILISSLFFAFLVCGQEDSTVYLKPIFTKGTLLNYKIRNSNVSEINGEGSFSSNGYNTQLEVLKSAYGLSVVRMNYDAFGSDYEPGSESTLKVKDELKAFFTIDSITRFVAIENSKQLLDTLSKRITNFQLDEESIASFFPEIELLFFLNGAKYVKGEKYTTSTILPVDGELLECDLEFEMTLFSRQENVFRIECTATPKTVSDQIKDFKYFLIYSFRLSDLFPKSITLQTSYHKGQNKYSSKTEITLN